MPLRWQLTEGWWDDEVSHVVPDYFFLFVTERLLGSRIEFDDVAVFVAGNDAIQRRLQNGALTGLALP